MKKRITALLVLLLLAGLACFFFFSHQLVSWLWYRSLGALPQFWLPLLTKLGLRLGLGIFCFGFLLLNLGVTKKAFLELQTEVKFTPRQHFYLSVITALVLTLFLLPGSAPDWTVVQQYLHRTAFGVTDPIFQLDLGFYLFAYPFYQRLIVTLLGLTLLTLLGVTLFYVIAQAYWYQDKKFQFWPRARVHLTLLGVLFFLLKAADYFLSRCGLLFEEKPLLTGVDYTTHHIRILGYNIMVLIAILTALLLLWTLFKQRPQRLLFGSLGLWLVSLLLFTLALPPLVETVVVKPNQFIMEEPYLEHHIRFTRFGFGLDRIEERPYTLVPEADPAVLDPNHPSLANLRIWDWRPLLPAYNQLQSFRSYYTFHDIDLDRYPTPQGQKQVMIAARELDPTKIDQNWLNRHLVYTHGYGLAMNAVNQANNVVQPLFLVKDLPPVVDKALPALDLTRPQIYFGEGPDSYVIVRTREKEFDYPATGGENVTTSYQGRDGIALRRKLVRLLLAVELRNRNLILSGYIQDQSKILLHRNIKERVAKLAPFLVLDNDPYLVVAENRLFWMLDAYTVSRHLPYAAKHPNGFNYIRNSVKVVVDAYHGTVDFYVVDPDDPIIQTWQKVFPRMFKAFTTMPEALQQHIRYPEALFTVQQDMLLSYHLTDAKAFYEKEDFWSLPTQIYARREETLEPYYVTLVLPGEEREEFLLMRPFTPRGKQNMIAWLVARCDPPNYGQLILYQLPKGTNIFGPMQIEARISQHPEITELITLWSQSQSQLIRGNLLVIPIGGTILYAEPFYIQSNQAQIPEFKKIVLVWQDQVVIADHIEAALHRLKGEVENAAVTPEPTPSPEQPAPEAAVSEPGAETAPPSVKAPDFWADFEQKLAEAEQKIQEGQKSFQESQEILREIRKLLEETKKGTPGLD
ncbi:MAG: COG1615 family transporter [Firmicutes bacterium]|nr:COG1615 family transporter [Bacillota bacterium]